MAIINGTAGNDILAGSDAADTIYGLGGDDTIDGGLGADYLYGGSGNDLFKFSSVQVSYPAPTAFGLLDGGDGYDTIDLTRISPVTLAEYPNDAGGYDLGLTVGSQGYETKSIEQINLGDRNDFVSLSSISGLKLNLGAGNDFALTSAGNEIFGEAGDDQIFISGGRQSLGRADGGSGFDTLITNIGFVVDLAAGTAISGDATYKIANFERLQMSLSGYAATGLGDDSANIMSTNPATYDDGSAGVTFDGRGGNDYISGGAGNDTLIGGTGNDTVSYEYATGAVRVDLAAGLATGAAGRDTLSGFETVMGSAYGDVIIGDTNRNYLSGGAGDDLLATVSGARSLKPGGGSDIIDGGGGADTLQLGGARSDYQLLTSGGKSYFVTAGGATEVVNVEAVQFGATAPTPILASLAGVKAFDGLSYIASYSDLRSVFGTNADRGTEHFVNAGFNEERAVQFSGLDYIASYADLRGAFGADATAGARHFIQYGAGEGRGTTFNGWSYLASYSDLIRAIGPDEGAAARHYIQAGANEGRGITFDATAYGKANPDLVNVFGNDADALARHYVTYGYTEGRALAPRTAAATAFEHTGLFAEDVSAVGASVGEGVFASSADAGAVHGVVHDFASSAMISQTVDAFGFI